MNQLASIRAARAQPPGRSRNKVVRVLHVINNLDVGGAEKRLLDITRHVDPSRFKLHFCTFSEQVGALGSDFEAAGAKLHSTRMGVRFPYQFKKILQQQSIDVVHAHMHFSAGYVLRLAARFGTPTRIAHFRSCKDGRKSNLRRRLQRRLLRHWIDQYATDILACGKTAMASNWGQPWAFDSRCKIVYNGVDSTPFECPRDRLGVAQEFNISSEGPLYIHVGNLRRPKNHPKLLSVFAHLVKKNPTASLLLVGRSDDDFGQDIRSLASKLGISRSVVFAGQRDDVPRLLRSADAMIFPSLWEGLPGAVLEACASGVPVLASDLPEIREIAEHLPLVQCLPLSASHQEWAEAARALVSGNRCKDHSATQRKNFHTSPFHIQHSVRSLCETWGEPHLEESKLNRSREA